MSRPYAERRPTEAAAIGRAERSRQRQLPASEHQLRERLLAAIQTDDGHGLRLLTARLARSSA